MNHTTILSSQGNIQNEILNIRRTIVRLQGDSGESSHLMREYYQHCLGKIVNTAVNIIIIPETGTLQANKHGSQPLPSKLSPAETIATIVPGLKSSYLLSLGQLYEDDCNVLPNKQNMYAIKDK